MHSKTPQSLGKITRGQTLRGEKEENVMNHRTGSMGTWFSAVLVAGMALGTVLGIGIFPSAAGDTISITGSIQHKTIGKTPTLVLLEAMGAYEVTPPKEPVVMNQMKKKFVPFMLPVVIGTTVKFLNSDAMTHNVMSPDGEGYNLGAWGRGEAKSRTFEKPGVYTQLCTLHPEMVGYVIVCSTPFFTEVQPDGTFKLESVPPGKWNLRVWNERLSPKLTKKVHPIEVKAGEVTNIEIKF